MLNEKVLKDDKNSKKVETKFYTDVCIYLNTVDYIKETLQSVQDSLGNLLDEPFNENIDFKNEEDCCVSTFLTNFLGTIIECICQHNKAKFGLKVALDFHKFFVKITFGQNGR